MKQFNRIYKFSLFTFLLFLSTNNIITQTIRFEHITTENGLSQNSVNCIIQDSKGFIWIGTADGLNKYDGVKFNIYRHKPYDTNSIANNTIMDIHEDKQGFIWVSTYIGGLSRYDPGNEIFTNFKHNSNDSNSISADNVKIKICEDSEGNIWILTSAGIDKFDKKSNKFIHRLRLKNNSFAHCIFIDRDNVLWVPFVNGEIMTYKIEGDSFYFIEKYLINIGKKQIDIGGVYQTKDNFLWFLTYSQGLLKFNKRKNEFFLYKYDHLNSTSISSDKIYSVVEDNEENLWIGTWNSGLEKFDRKNNVFIHHRNDPSNKYSLSNDNVYSLFVDKNNILWIGTYGGGVDKYNVYKNRFNRIAYNSIIRKGLNDPWIFPILEDNTGKLWIGTLYGGINIFDRKTDTGFSYIRGIPKYLNQRPYILSSILQDTSGFIWIGDSYGLAKYDQKSKKILRISNEISSRFSNPIIRYILEDKNNDLWLGSLGGGLFKYKKKQNKFYNYFHDPDDTNSISGNDIETIFEDRYGILWIGTFSSGLNKFDRKNNSFICYNNIPGDKKSLSHNMVSVIYEDSKGNLWVGTKGGGLNKFDRTNGTFEHIYHTDGLANDVVYGILEDNKSNLWISTNNGLSKYNIQNGVFRNYDINDGLLNNEFNTNSFFKNKNGEMLFGCVGGIIYFDPEKIINNKYIPPIKITSIIILEKEFKNYENYISDIDGIKFSQKYIELKYNEGSISFEFAALDFANPAGNRFAYKLDGLDEYWIYCGNRHFVNYTNLNSGEYIFMVKGSNSDDLWNENGAAIKIVIKPAPWKTWWAYFVYSFMLFSIFILFLRYKLKQNQMKINLLKEQSRSIVQTQEDERKRISRELHDSVNQLLISAKNKIDSLASPRESEAKELKDIINSAVEEVRTISNNLHPLILDDLGLLGTVYNLSKKFKSRTNINIEIETHDFPKYLPSQMQINLYRIIQEALNNIEKHSEASEVYLFFYRHDDSYFVNIKDNGNGFDIKALKSINTEKVNFGLHNMKERTNFLQGTITINSFPGKGTEIEIKIPIIN